MKKRKFIIVISYVVAAISAAALAVWKILSNRRDKLRLREDIRKCGVVLDEDDIGEVFTYWIPISQERGEPYESNVSTLIKTYMVTNGIITALPYKDSLINVYKRRIYITNLSPDYSGKSKKEIARLLDVFYNKFCSNDNNEEDVEAYNEMKKEFEL